MNTTPPSANDWTKDRINTLLLGNPLAIERALIVLHDRQTQAEQQSQTTSVANGRGFSGTDALFLSSLAERVKKGWGLTHKQLACLTRTNKQGYCQLAKYHNQLRQEITARAEQVALAYRD